MIPVLRPKLPTAEAIAPYLQQIDNNRWYSNYGPMVQALEERIGNMIRRPAEEICIVANGTLGLTVALQALEVPRGSVCLMPSWTFTATPAAALAAGMEPCFLDVDVSTQALSPEQVKAAIRTISGQVGAVIAVSPFGRAVDTLAWDRFTEETGIPVVIDAAAAFDTLALGLLKPARTPVMVSLHATKTLGIGEGGILVSKNPDTMVRMRRMINFGFEMDRRSHRIAINAKLSEYGAAIAMAALDAWPETRAAWARVRDEYVRILEPAGYALWLDRRSVSSTCNVIVPDAAVEIAELLAQAGVETRRWWLTGCHAQPAYRSCMVHGELTGTQWLGQSVLGLPAAVDMAEADIQEVCAQLKRADAVARGGGMREVG